jgi:hypothetical protein
MDDWKELAKWLWGLLVPAAWWMWNKQDKRLDGKAEAADVKEMKESLHSLRNKVVTKDDFAAHEARDQKDRDERRETEIKLFDKIDRMKDDFSGKLDGIKDLLIARKP